jgi:hypothetical protein
MSDVESAQRAINELDKQQYGVRGPFLYTTSSARISARRIRACRTGSIRMFSFEQRAARCLSYAWG